MCKSSRKEILKNKPTTETSANNISISDNCQTYLPSPQPPTPPSITTTQTMLKLFPLRRSFSLDLAPDDSNSNFLLHVNDDIDLIGHSPSAIAYHLPISANSNTIKSNLSTGNSNINNNNNNMSTTTATNHNWQVDDTDDALAADFDGSLSGLGIELGTASFNMSEALMALPSLSSLKLHNHHPNNHHHHHHHRHQRQDSSSDDSGGSQNSNIALGHEHSSPSMTPEALNNTSNLVSSVNQHSTNNHINNHAPTTTNGHNVSTSSGASGGSNGGFISSLSLRNYPQHGSDTIASSLDRHCNSDNNTQPIIINNGGVEDKPIAVVHGKKNRLTYSTEDESISTSIKRFCLNNDRDFNSVNLLLPNVLISSDEHQCDDECLNGTQCHLRHSSSVPDLRYGSAPFSPALPQLSHSAASSPSSSSISNPSNTFFSHIIAAQFQNGNQNVSSGNVENQLTNDLSASVNDKNESSKFQYVLGASTSMAIKINEETMTYLNQGQSYEIKLKKVGDLSDMKGKILKTLIRVCFHDRRLQYMEKELIEQWKEQRPSERVLEVDIPLSYGINDVRNDSKFINRSEFYWDPTKETGVFIRINCISTEFTPKKHGGEKGVPFRILIETYSKDDLDHCLHAASCQVKVFKPKGADRKHKTDREKMIKKPICEQEKFQPSYDCTVFTDCSMDAFALYSLAVSSSSSTCSTVVSALKSINEVLPKLAPMNESNEITASKNTIVAGPKVKITSSKNNQQTSSTSLSLVEKSDGISHILSDISDNSYDLSFSNFPSLSFPKLKFFSSSATAEETQNWLKDNRFEAYLETFENFSGSDFLLLSKDDLIQICGLTDGIRLFNALHSKQVKSKLSIYVCSTQDELFRAIYLDSLTVSELQTKLAAGLLSMTSKYAYIKRLCILGPAGVKILITDDVVRNIQDESLYLIEFTKDYNGEFHGVMKPYNGPK